jgi:hypothetical protein
MCGEGLSGEEGRRRRNRRRGGGERAELVHYIKRGESE